MNLLTIRTFVTPKPGSGAVNLRSTDKIDPANIVGMINEGTRLEYYTRTGSWYVGKVYVSTEAAEAFGNQFIKPRAVSVLVYGSVMPECFCRASRLTVDTRC